MLPRRKLKCFCACPKQCGQSLVEFALVLVILFVLVFGIVELGRAVFAYNTIANSAREATRYAITHGSDSLSPVGPQTNHPTVERIVRNFTTGLQSNLLSVSSTWTNISGTVQNAPGATVTVTVNYLFIPTVFEKTATRSNFFWRIPLQSRSSATIVN